VLFHAGGVVEHNSHQRVPSVASKGAIPWLGINGFFLYAYRGMMEEQAINVLTYGVRIQVYE
jgi:nitrogen regulatory protein PII-like uncharacterized protein